jgi:hypothetical protein
MFAAWIWAVYFTFPGTYSTQPAVTTQVHKFNNALKVHKNENFFVSDFEIFAFSSLVRHKY